MHTKMNKNFKSENIDINASWVTLSRVIYSFSYPFQARFRIKIDFNDKLVEIIKLQRFTRNKQWRN